MGTKQKKSNRGRGKNRDGDEYGASVQVELAAGLLLRRLRNITVTGAERNGETPDVRSESCYMRASPSAVAGTGTARRCNCSAPRQQFRLKKKKTREIYLQREKHVIPRR